MSAPVTLVYPVAEGPRRPASGRMEPAKYDFSDGFDAAPLAAQLSHHTPIPIPYQAPINWGKIGSTVLFAASSLLLARFCKPVLTGRLIWIIATVVPSLAFMGGLMFVQIRGSPWEMANGQWMAQGYSNQFGKEVQMIAIICRPRLFLALASNADIIPQTVRWLVPFFPLYSSLHTCHLLVRECRSTP